MPAPINTLVKSNTSSRIQVSSDQVATLLNSLMSISNSKNLSGYDNWIKETASLLTADEISNNYLVMIGLHYAVMPAKRWKTIPDYIAYLEKEDALVLRDRVLYAYEEMASMENHIQNNNIEWKSILDNKKSFMDSIIATFDKQKIDVEMESKAFDLLINPAEMKQLIVSHLQVMWEKYLQPEWDRILPVIMECVDAYGEINLEGLNSLQAGEKIIGRELTEMCAWALKDENLKEIVFVPSAHIGPYIGVSKSDDVLWINFGAKLPEGSNFDSPLLSRSELLVRLDALADDNRLQILKLIVENGETCSKDIIEKLSLSQSATSRHLKQLSATGYLIERRKESAKCYRLNTERIENTIDALQNYFSIS